MIHLPSTEFNFNQIIIFHIFTSNFDIYPRKRLDKFPSVSVIPCQLTLTPSKPCIELPKIRRTKTNILAIHVIYEGATWIFSSTPTNTLSNATATPNLSQIPGSAARVLILNSKTMHSLCLTLQEVIPGF